MTADFLASNGWDIAICSRNEAEVKDAAERLAQEHGVASIGMAVNIADPIEVESFARRVSVELGPVHALVCNAAILGPVGSVAQVEPADMAATLAVNVLGFSNCLKFFWPGLVAVRGFRVIALAGGGLGGPGQMKRAPAYVPSKAALVSMIEMISDEVVEAGGTINAIAPGNIPTGFMKSVLLAGEVFAGKELFEQAAEREGKPVGNSLERFFDLLSFLLDEHTDFVSGRFLSARWNTPDALASLRTEGLSDSLFTLRRIDDDLYSEGKP